MKQAWQKGLNMQFALILGIGSLGKQFYDNLMQYPEMGYDIVEFLNDYRNFDDREVMSLNTENINGKNLQVY